MKFYRYSGKTQKQMQEYVRENFVKRQSFQRNARIVNASDLGTSLSAQPLLPIGDTSIGKLIFDVFFGFCYYFLWLNYACIYLVFCVT